MDKVYVLSSFDGEDTHVLGVYRNEATAKVEKEKRIQDEIDVLGVQWDSYFITEYKLL